MMIITFGSLTNETEGKGTEEEHYQLPFVEIVPADDWSTQEEVEGGLGTMARMYDTYLGR